MSPVVDALSRIQQIQATLVQLRTGAVAGAAPAATGASGGVVTGGSASSFATALASSAGGAGATGASGASGAAGASGASGVGAAPAAAASAVTGDDVVAAAERYLGVPYVFGGEDRSGMDCSGLVQRVFADLGIAVPRVVPDQARLGTEVASLAEARPGDLVVSRGTGHIGIWLGDGKILHAPRPGKDVQIVDNYLKDSDVTTIRRVVPATGAGTDLTTAALQRLLASGGAS